MWPLVYLSLFNAGLGFALAAWACYRCRCTRRWRQLGYDQRIFCPPSTARLKRLHRRPPFGIDKILQHLGVSSPASHQTNDAHPTSPPDVAAVGTASDRSNSSDLSELAAPSDPATASVLSNTSPPVNPSVRLDPSTAIDPSDLAVLVDPIKTATVSELPNQQTATETTAQSLAFRQRVDRTSNIWDASTAAEIVDTNSHEAPQFLDRPQTPHDDFLARAALIDTGLRALMELEQDAKPAATEPDQEANLWQEISTQIHATHHWWTDFEGSLTDKLTRGADGRPIHPEQRAQVEDDLVAMQASLMECQSLLAEARSAIDTPASREPQGKQPTRHTAPKRVRGGLMGAIKACHHLRDNLVMLLPTSPLQFHTCSRQGTSEQANRVKPLPSYVAQLGIAGVNATIQNWQNQLTSDTPNVASLLLVDFDRTNDWNQRFGLEAIDWVLDTCHRQIAESIRFNRGFDRVIRVGGQQFLLFLGSTPVASAKFAADRLRQTFEQTTWQFAEHSLVLHCSVTVGSFRSNQPIAAQINALRLGMAEAKRLGGNVVVEPSPSGRFQQITGVPAYSPAPRQHLHPCEKWNPKAAVSG